MKLKTLRAWLIVLVFLVQTQGIVSAQGTMPSSPLSWDDVIKHYGLKPVDVVPIGVTCP